MKPWLPGTGTGTRNLPVETPPAEVATNGHGSSAGGQLAVVDGADGKAEPLLSSVRVISHPAAEVTPPVPPTPASPADVEAAPLTGWRAHVAASWLWRTRGFWLGGAGMALSFWGQKVLIVDHDVVSSIRWYALGIITVLVAWLGTYKNKTLLVEPDSSKNKRRTIGSQAPASTAPQAPVPPAILVTTLPVRSKNAAATRATSISTITTPTPTTARASRMAALRVLSARHPFAVGTLLRYVAAFAALGLNLFSTSQLRSNYYSVVGSLGWVASLLLLVVAFLGERKREVKSNDYSPRDNEDRDRISMSRWVETAILLSICALTFAMRVYRLDDWTGGMHGDEGETAMDAVHILEGDRVSPFLTGWFNHPNFSFWSVALTMKVFGMNLFGLRFFSVLLGTLMVLPFYGLVRIWFGIRTAIIAAVLLAVMDVSVYFGRLGLNNITTPFFLVMGFYFLARGLRSLRTLDFILSGYGFMLTLYFYFGGRLTPVMVAVVLAYLFLLMPVVRIPGTFHELRRRTPGLQVGKAIAGAIGVQARFVWQYSSRLLMFGVAAFCMLSPWLVYFVDNQGPMNERSNEKLILNPSNQGRMTQQYNATHDPLYIGLRMPTPADIYPVLPVVFEKTPLSIQVAADGLWPRIFWDQTVLTLSMFTYRPDASSFYTFTGEPVDKPIEATLLVLGIAWALWRWRDSRMSVLSIWFWLTIFAGGVLTIDAPYMPRLVGLFPVMAIFIAIPLNKFAAEFQNAFSYFRRSNKAAHFRFVAARLVAASGIVLLLVYSGLQNFNDYYTRYIAGYPDRGTMGQAYFVRQMSAKVAAEGRPTPMYYDLGMHMVYWGHGVNRFLNHGTPGDDMINPSNLMPVLNNGDRDVVFMVWPFNLHYLSAFEQYYPGGEEADFNYGPAGSEQAVFRYYRVKKEQIEARRQTTAAYKGASGQPVERDEPGIGTTSAPPAGLAYPAQATWTGHVIAPAMGRYHMGITANGQGRLLVDGTQVLTTTASLNHAEADLTLARGLHDIQLEGVLARSDSKVSLGWSSSGAELADIPRQYLYNGPSKAFFGKITGLTTGGDAPPSDGASLGSAPRSLITARTDGFLGFRSTPDVISPSSFQGTWTGTLAITQTGQYTFDVYSNGGSTVLIDGQEVLKSTPNGAEPTQASGQVQLEEGPHRYELRYAWQGGTGYLEAFWTPPGGVRAMLGPDALHADGGILDSTLLANEPPPVDVNKAADSAQPVSNIVKPAKVLPLGDAGVVKPRGLAVDKAGNVYVGDRGNHRVVVLSPDGKVLHAWGKAAPAAPAGTQPSNLAPGDFAEINDLAVIDQNTSGSDPAGVTVYVLDSLQRVQAFNGKGDPVGIYEAPQLGLFGANGIATLSPVGTAKPPVGSAGFLYLAVTGQGRIAKLPIIQALLAKGGDKSGSTALGEMTENVTGSDPDKLDQPVDVVLDPSNPDIMYIIDLKDRVAQLQRTQGMQASATPGATGVGNGNPQSGWAVVKSWKVPVGRDDGGSRLGISPDGGHVYMSDPDRKRVAVVDVKSGAVSYFGSEGGDAGQFRGPTGIAVNLGGEIYVLDRENANVQIFAPGSK